MPSIDSSISLRKNAGSAASPAARLRSKRRDDTARDAARRELAIEHARCQDLSGRSPSRLSPVTNIRAHSDHGGSLHVAFRNSAPVAPHTREKEGLHRNFSAQCAQRKRSFAPRAIPRQPDRDCLCDGKRTATPRTTRGAARRFRAASGSRRPVEAAHSREQSSVASRTFVSA